MEYRKLDPQTDYTLVDMTLYLQDVKVLYNACMDITAQYPEMIGYKKIMDKLVLVIDEFDNTENKQYICKTMGQTKKLYEEMSLNELITEFFNQSQGDEDYLYEEYKQRKMDEYNQELMEREAYEEMLADKY